MAFKRDSTSALKPNVLNAFEKIESKDSTFTIWVNLPEFKLRVYYNGQIIDSARIAIGRYFAPIVESEQYEVVYRPSFYPTEKELVKGYVQTPPDRTNYPARPRNPLGRRRITIWNVFRMHGTNRDNSIGNAASNGCTRVENLAIERFTDTIISWSKIKRHYGKKGACEIFILEKPVRVIQTYRLWNYLQINDSVLSFTGYTDPHRRLNIFSSSASFPVRMQTPGAAYNSEHLLNDLAKLGININMDDSFEKSMYEEFWKNFSQVLKKNKKSGSLLQISIPEYFLRKKI